jgi:hypothetical protein
MRARDRKTKAAGRAMRSRQAMTPSAHRQSGGNLTESGGVGAQDMLRLQGAAGNQAVRRMLVAKQSEGLSAIQRFGSKEHQELGDVGSGGLAYHFGPGGPRSANYVERKPFRLNHGDIVALSGDYFDPRDTITEGTEQKPNPDSLFRIAGTPSTNPGKQPRTQDEIIYALKKAIPSDPRFARTSSPDQHAGGEWAELEFSDEVKKAVDDRYLTLAAANREHFASPTGTVGGPHSGLGASAGGSYRALHEDAILRAFYAGQEHGDVGEAQAREAAAAHFLTDHFAAGHLRTPRQSIRDFWRAKYPLFFGNMKKKIALDVARYMNDASTNVATALGTVSSIYDKVIAQVHEKTEGMPELGFDDLVAGVAHDVDNRTGLWVVNALGDRWRAYGDSNLHKDDPENRTPEMAELSVGLGLDDIRHAHAIGAATPGPIAPEWVLAQVKLRTSTPARPADTYGAEQILPRLDETADNGQQSWQGSGLDELWSTRPRSDMPATYGSEITASLEKGEIHDTLEAMANKFPPDEEVWQDTLWGYQVYLGTLHPQEAFRKGFFEPLVGDPLSGLRGIVDFNPSEGQAFFNEDDAVMEEAATFKPGEFAGLTLNQRAERIKALTGGTFNSVSDEEAEMVIRLFETARNPGDRPQLYRLVEGRAWTGNWIHGVFRDDDEIYNSLDRDQLDRLRALINEPVAAVPAGAR